MINTSTSGEVRWQGLSEILVCRERRYTTFVRWNLCKFICSSVGELSLMLNIIGSYARTHWMIELYLTFSLNRTMIQDKKAKKEMPLLGWSIAEPQDTDKVQDVSLTLKVNISSYYLLANTLFEKLCPLRSPTWMYRILPQSFVLVCVWLYGLK